MAGTAAAVTGWQELKTKFAMKTRTAITTVTTKVSRPTPSNTNARVPRLELTNEVAERYLPRVQRHAVRIARKLPRHVNVGDLVSAGFCGLVDAFMRFDAARMDSFEAYVDHRIRGAILDELRSHDPLTRDQRLFARRVTQARHALAARGLLDPGEREIAKELGLNLTQYRHQVDRMHATAVRSDPTPFNEEEDMLAEPANDLPDALAAAKQSRERIDAAMATLPQRLRDLLRMHYDEGRTLREIGVALGVTESRVSQLHAEAVTRMREALGSIPGF